jgi:hypothetical protein
MYRTQLQAIVLGLSVAAATPVWAQNSASPARTARSQQPLKPVQPMPSAKSDTSDAALENTEAGVQALPIILGGDVESVSIAGAQAASLAPKGVGNYLIPGVSYYGEIDSNGSNHPTSGGYQTVAIHTLLGGVTAQKISAGSQLNLNYLGGRSLSKSGDLFNGWNHELGVSEAWSRGRWNGLLADQLKYSSQTSYFGGSSPFDISGLSGLVRPGLTQPDAVVLRTSFLASQGIFTTYGASLSNGMVAQIDNHLTRRTAFTIVGNYGILRFVEPGLIDSSGAGFQIGIGHSRTRQDSIGLVYRFNDLWFNGASPRIRDNVVQLSYRHRVGERLLFQIGAGPEFSQIQDTGANYDKRLSWSVDTSFEYHLRRITWRTTYNRYLTSGGGLFLGAVTDQVNVTLDREFSRVWLLNVTGSYSRNQNLISFATPAARATAGAIFNSEYAGIEVHRKLGINTDMFLGFFSRYQKSNPLYCGDGICGKALKGQQAHFGITWRSKPIPVG